MSDAVDKALEWLEGQKERIAKEVQPFLDAESKRLRLKQDAEEIMRRIEFWPGDDGHIDASVTQEGQASLGVCYSSHYTARPFFTVTGGVEDILNIFSAEAWKRKMLAGWEKSLTTL